MANDQAGGEGPKLHIDSDWKAEAQREKQKLAEKAKPAGDAGGVGAGPKGEAASTGAASKSTGGTSGGTSGAASGGGPPADFETLVSTMATQALFAMGAIPDPRTGQRIAHLDLARHHIDMLGVLEDKTRGNLSEDEADMLSSTLYELRTHYVQIASSARSSAGGGLGGAGGAAGGVQPPGV